VAYKVIFAPAAIARLEGIVRYIAVDDPGTAERFCPASDRSRRIARRFPRARRAVSKAQERPAAALRSLFHLLSSQVRTTGRRDHGILARRPPGATILRAGLRPEVCDVLDRTVSRLRCIGFDCARLSSGSHEFASRAEFTS
jgi:plasmid stabilization system protein ParE